jgi:hypothetical protein
MSTTSIGAGLGRPVPTLTRRSAIRTGGLAALAAGLLGTVDATEASTPPAPTIVGTTTNMADLIKEV